MIDNNDIEGLKQMRERQPDFLYLRDDSGWTPLFYASWNNKPSVVKLFINIGCNLGAVDFSFQSSYHLSARAGHAKVLNILCQYDIKSLNQGDDYNRTPLYFASLHGNIACVDTLLRHNADTAVMSSMGETAYDVAGEQSEEKRHVIQKMIEDHMSSLLIQVDS
ncbi:DNA-binding protein RFXANK-like [Hydractinia symbiolongicarpus]|uniref:DNA-binding protein RFXANK-like n=1 Tax=Hydractinia symbiolongicarpus TaxID=13093 RepID=UPI00254CD1F3|nr:DNA-binding protein RFXANK-like [Hydractinia symbiolongicarpus]